jgi:UDP-N-acetylmuramoylalanine-D-glutamate ligase
LQQKSGILFSPGHPSGEDFQNFEVRGNYFKSLAREIFDD